MKIVPITLRKANEFVEKHHRHNGRCQGHKFSVALEDRGELIGVAICGRPVSRVLDTGRTLEVLRVCTLTDKKNACSMLYGACCRAAAAMGYTRVVTYTLKEELGTSPLASGFQRDGAVAKSDGWSRPSRPRSDKDYPSVEKVRWGRWL